VRYDFLIGNFFQRSITEEAVLAVMGLEEREDSPQMMISALGMRGEVLMFHPSPGLLHIAGGIPLVG